MRSIFFMVCWAVLGLSAQAQGIMNFKTETHDFGMIDEGTIATHEFEFVNTGNQPIEIREVKASCGCTSPSWSKEPIFPGKRGKIKAEYDSNQRPGPFVKTLTIYSNAQKPTLFLTIKGFVKGSEDTSKPRTGALPEGSEDPNAAPKLTLDRHEWNFGRVESGTQAKQIFNIYNQGKGSLILTGLESRCRCVSFSMSSAIVPPGQTMILELTLNADKVQSLEEEFTLRTNDPEQPTKVIKLYADVYQDFSKQMFKNPKKTLGGGR